jgi:hypothetical protein
MSPTCIGRHGTSSSVTFLSGVSGWTVFESSISLRSSSNELFAAGEERKTVAVYDFGAFPLVVSGSVIPSPFVTD